MKKKLLTVLKFAFIALLVLSARLASGQIVFTSTPDSIAVLNELYTYDVNAAATPNAPTFSLDVAPAGMTIDASTGLISWTPTNINAGHLVKVKAVNSGHTAYQNFCVYVTNAVVCDTNIISYWPLDAKVGSSVVDYAHGYNGLWLGAPGPEPVIAPGKVGNSIKFDPTNQDDWGYDVLDQDQYEFSGATEFSVSFWFKNEPSKLADPSTEILVGRYTGNSNNLPRWNIQWNPVNLKIEFYMQDNGPTDTTVVSGIEIDDNLWHHVVATFFNGTDLQQKAYMHLYVDGVSSLVLYDFWRDSFAGTGNLFLGYNYWAQNPFSGNLDEVAIWKKELLPADVAALRAQGIAGTPLCHDGDVAPIITSTPVTTGTEDIDYSYTLTYRSMSPGVTMSAQTKPAWLNFNTTTGVLSGKPLNADAGVNNVTLRISQGGIDIDQTFTINVAGVNDPPVFTSSALTTVVAKQQYQYFITTSDEEGQALTLTCPVKPAWLGFTSNTGSGVLLGTPTRANVGMHDVTLQVTDGTSTTSQIFTIEVTLDNNVPVITSTEVTTATKDVLYSYTITATDADADALTYSAPTLPSWMNFNTSTHVLSGLPAAANLGDHNVVLEVTDGKDAVQQSFTITVTSDNNAPVITSTPATSGMTSALYSYTITATDVDADALTYSAPTLPTWMNFNATTHVLSGTPVSANIGIHNVVLEVTDGESPVQQSFTINIIINGVYDVTSSLARVYPVPASEYVVLEFAEKLDKADLQILNLAGALIKKIDISNLTSYRLDVSDLKPNNYIYRIISNKGQQSGPIVIQ
jgi:hypothetical protein